jgi:signal recognition particle receptor subunit alpha
VSPPGFAQSAQLTTPGGLILYARSFTPAFTSLASTPANPVNVLVREAFIEGKARSEEEGFEKDGYSVRWNMENGLGLVFVVRICLTHQGPS